MNYKFYVFGESSGYKQYPDDSIDFKSWYRSQQANSLLTIQRKQDLIYYIYTQAIDKEKKSFIGFCLVFNGVYIKNAKKSFELFEKLYSETIMSGKLFRINHNGVIGFATDSFASQTKEIERLNTLINDELIRYGRSFFATLPTSYRTGEGGQNFTMTDGVKVLAQAINVYDYITISNDNTNGDLDYVENMIQKLYTENVQIKKEYAQLNKKKKQYKWVSVLSVIVVICLVAIYILNDNLTNTIMGLRRIVENQNTHIGLLQDTLKDERMNIHEKEIIIRNLNNRISSYKQSLKDAEEKIEDVKNVFPIQIVEIDVANHDKNSRAITDYGDPIYSSQTMYLSPRIRYKGLDIGKSVKLKMKLYNADGELSVGKSSPSDYSYSCSVYVSNGYNTEELSGWGSDTKGHWKAGLYRFEIWYKDVCLKTKTFRVY